MADHKHILVAIDTIVVGYGSYSWIRDQLHTHVSDQLMAASDDLAVCVVR